MLYILALLIGVVAGLRAGTALAATAWGAWLGWLPVANSWASFMGHWIAVGIFTILGIVELITDQLPSTPSRKVPEQFGARIVVGAFCGAVIGAPAGATIGGLIAGAIGAVVGTLGGAEARARLAAAFGRDPPAAFIEDAVAIAGGLLIVAVLT
ncbi:MULTISPECIES: DUF4126 domain-containing protein [unclassified Mesorhizobium]|uniref:DUF4126 domain-containing protein n=1 Tax=unclassified Mesorhizobium TaxID=325217 RepID=UPI000BAF0068|nr:MULTISPECIES: DUF4126 domain-containing protein [unclassified Mesorhizobium]TGT53316.1 DUF4126 domain-containing protein [Mesorhizobium sp. M00.F.Ca.ET.170.01.1.1]AZO11789.1 DUF4126 domain-containing protein [Mesorhizobium sp. M3A.F.Ca.ET.080.04.2.1]PBB83616.1 DUF4126 domain-containing protein [Mesorhizobium sp. WSM3876]RWB72574.1 MAG: DUF4126 domain-containing protein [Mesorhizobium sp.]RWB87155.1 MAG: DUF4126 domain-containing protein [Mesorhizobium sp.]